MKGHTSLSSQAIFSLSFTFIGVRNKAAALAAYKVIFLWPRSPRGIDKTGILESLQWLVELNTSLVPIPLHRESKALYSAS